MNLFNVVPTDFFKPLTGKYRNTFIDCLTIIYKAYRNQLSFGVDKDVIVSELEYYFDNEQGLEMVFEDDNESVSDSKSKANTIIRRLKDTGWLEQETSSDYKIKINLFDYSVVMIESFNKIVNREEIEYQSYISQIYAMLNNEEGYNKPYENIIKRVAENTEELIIGLKKLNTNIKKYIDKITSEKTAAQIIDDFFLYHKEVGSKAYHRIKTSENVSHYRNLIIEKLKDILHDEEKFKKAVEGYNTIEQIDDYEKSVELLKEVIVSVISAFRNYDDIIEEIDTKHSRYLRSAVERAKFLLNNTSNIEGNIRSILSNLANEFNNDQNLNLNDEIDDYVLNVFSIFTTNYIDGSSFYVVPITRKTIMPEELTQVIVLSDEERELKRLALQEKNKNRFSKKNINTYVDSLLQNKSTILGSSLPLQSKRDFIKMIFVSLYGHDKSSLYKVTLKENTVKINNFEFKDFIIERKK